ncbi:MAG: MFS transporter, partial [Rickettsiales bacterium]
MKRENVNFFFLNVGHFMDHLFVLIFATAVIKLAVDWNLSYQDLLPYAAPGMVAFGIGAIPAGWVADKWNRQGMMQIFFVGIGLASIGCSFATTPIEMAVGLFAIGCFAAIYHPVGIAMVVQGRAKTGMPLALNGVFGNLGVAAAPLLTGAILDFYDWRWAFIVPGVLSIAIGIAYWVFVRAGALETMYPSEGPAGGAAAVSIDRQVIFKVFGIIFLSTALGGIIFQTTTYSLPEIFNRRLGDLAGSLTEVGLWSAFVALMINLFGTPALLVSLAFMLVVFGQIPINDVLVGRVAKSEWRSRAYAARSFVTFSVMSITLPAISWLLDNRHSFTWAPEEWDQFAVVF